MAKIKYNLKQIKELIKNPYIKNSTESYIAFTAEGKDKALNMHKS